MPSFSNAETLSFAKLLADLTVIKPYVLDLRGEPCPRDAEDVSARIRKVMEAAADYVERELRSLQRHAGVDVVYHPKTDLAPAAMRAVIMASYSDEIRPPLVLLEEYLTECSEYERSQPVDHSLSARQLGVGRFAA